jgi:hypothetical protein
LYSLRRERAHLFRLVASCQVQSSDVCSDFVAARLLDNAALLATMMPNLTNAPLLARVASIESIVKRSCESDLPCLSRVVDPILRAPDYTSAVQAFANAKVMLEMRLPNEKFEAELFTRISMPMSQCSFDVIVASGHGSCPAQEVQDWELSKWMFSKSYESRMTLELKNTILNQLSSCWLGCRLKRRAAEMAVRASLVQGVNIELVRRYVMILCESAWCIQATSTPSLQELLAVLGFVTFFSPDLLYSVMGLIVESLLIMA